MELEIEAEDEGYDLDQEKLAKESNETVVDILKCLSKRSFIVAGDAISRSIALFSTMAVTANMIDPDTQEKLIENITKASKFYLDYTGDQANNQQKTH